MRRVLIANRGEIALRIARTCRRLGLETVAVYSDADASAPYVHACDRAVRLGPAPASESYLDIEKVVAAARTSRADAVHPGYGFLSENAEFAEACAGAGLNFVGPPPDVIRRTGSKTAARDAVQAAGVPVVPGETPDVQTEDALGHALRRVGLPALLKAVAGGGGRGMRIVSDERDIGEAVAAATREAVRAFGNGTLYVERLIARPRHIEVQIFGDRHGRVVHLFERDCTLQRRHQKVIEEAPAPALDPAVRERLTVAAVRAARAVGYVNAGTMEFLVDGEGADAAIYFLEVNTRLQVEHPVTEAITGLDLVELQLAVADTGRLPIRQEDVSVTGHAIECRIYAEDPLRLLPQSGRLLRYREPAGPGIRIDSGVVEGQEITVHYDPLLAKLIASDATREGAIARAVDALGRYEILGLRHNIPFLRALLTRAEVAEVRAHTRFIEAHLDELAGRPSAPIARAAAAIAAFVAASWRSGTPPKAGFSAPATTDANQPPAHFDPWLALGPIAW
jgi:3-methylcrotonyl-CoA carboxylase alpha subunit